MPARSAFMTRTAPVKTPLTQLQMRCEAPGGIAAAAAPPGGFSPGASFVSTWICKKSFYLFFTHPRGTFISVEDWTPTETNLLNPSPIEMDVFSERNKIPHIGDADMGPFKVYRHLCHGKSPAYACSNLPMAFSSSGKRTPPQTLPAEMMSRQAMEAAG